MTHRVRGSIGALSFLSCTLLLVGCGSKQESATTQQAATDAAAPAAAGSPAPAAGAATSATAAAWTPEALEQLLAPIAIYPDVVLGHVLNASTNPQEVLDAGNWLLEHQDLQGSALDEAATKLGISPSMRALLQFPETVDMMCMKMDWTTQLGEAFTADQGAVLDAVQRLRVQAKDVGNLQSSPQLAVETETQNDKEIVTVKPADPEVVYVPKYDPVAVYAPPPATIPPPTTIQVAAAPGTTTTTTVSAAGGTQVTTTTSAVATESTASEDKGHSTGALITTGLLAFGAGILVNEVFDDDDDWDDYYPNYGYGGIYYGSRPYYPPPPYMYRPPYGGGYYPAHGYTRPPNYQHGFNNNTIIVNNGGNNYWNDFNQGSPRVTNRKASSPISAAKPNRPELATLNREAADRAKAPKVAQRDAGPTDRKGQQGYAGATAAGKADRDRMVANAQQRPAAGNVPGADRQAASRDTPKRPQGTYAGATNRPASAATRDTAKANAAAARDPSRPKPSSPADRGDRPGAARPEHASPPTLSRDRPSTANRPEPASRPAQVDRASPSTRPSPSVSPSRDRTAFEGGNRNAAQERAASQRGRTSKPSGAQGGQRPRR